MLYLQHNKPAKDRHVTRVYFSQNTLAFWFPRTTMIKLHGTPEDAINKYSILARHHLTEQGVEFFFIPGKTRFRDFPSAFWTKGKKDKHSVHIGDPDPEFLIRRGTEQDLKQIQDCLQALEAERLVIHAHHLQHRRAEKRDILLHFFSDHKICIENNGFDSWWGAQPKNLLQIFTDCPDFLFCLDIAHVKDFPELCLQDFLCHQNLSKRIAQFHFSFSTRHSKIPDPGFQSYLKQYSPFHALYCLTRTSPSQKTQDILKLAPVVIEGVVPKEDTQLQLLRQERRIVTNRTKEDTECRQ